jgi:mRNA interferase HigB
VDILNRVVVEKAKKERPGWKGSLNSWERIIIGAAWRHFADVRLTLKSADNVGDCVVFNIARNQARLIALVHYPTQTVTVLGVLSLKDYDKDEWKDACHC